MPTVVIIATTGKDLHRLGGMISALQAQETDQGFDIVIADNTGDQKTGTYVDYININHPGIKIRLHYLQTAGRPGKAHAVNTTLTSELAETMGWSTVLILDDDDLVPPGYVDIMSRAVAEHGYVGARLELGRLNRPAVIARRAPVQDEALPVFMGVPFVVGAALGVDADVLRGVGGFDEDLLAQEDVDLGIRLDAAGVRPVLVSSTWVHYRYRSSVGEIRAQERVYGEWEVAVWVRHRGRLGRRRWRSSVGEAAATTRALLHYPVGREAWATRSGAMIGRIIGSLRHHVIYV